jgi:hypothetical protein
MFAGGNAPGPRREKLSAPGWHENDVRFMTVLATVIAQFMDISSTAAAKALLFSSPQSTE